MDKSKKMVRLQKSRIERLTFDVEAHANIIKRKPGFHIPPDVFNRSDMIVPLENHHLRVTQSTFYLGTSGFRFTRTMTWICKDIPLVHSSF
jgi:hypothetical protein